MKKMNNIKNTLQIIVMILTIGLLLGCVNNKNPTIDTTRVIITMPETSEPEGGFDPAFGWGAGEHIHEPLIQSTLVQTDTQMQIIFDLAVSLSVSEDGLLWIVKIRDDIRFSNGEMLTAEDVAFTYNTVKNLSLVADFTMLDSARAIDETTIYFYMNRPFSVFAYTMANVGIIPKKNYNNQYGQHPIGSGRYFLKQWDKGQQIILEANPLYYGELPKIKTIIILFMREEAAFAAVQAGVVDFAYTAPSYGESSTKQLLKNYELISLPTIDNRGFNLPTININKTIGNEVTSDKAIRQAINIGINRQKIIDLVLYGYGRPAFSV
ncbi:MAG: ABC transporter substrate-binding protein, partial [Treponemataceae bacterium]